MIEAIVALSTECNYLGKRYACNLEFAHKPSVGDLFTIYHKDGRHPVLTLQITEVRHLIDRHIDYSTTLRIEAKIIYQNQTSPKEIKRRLKKAGWRNLRKVLSADMFE